MNFFSKRRNNKVLNLLCPIPENCSSSRNVIIPSDRMMLKDEIKENRKQSQRVMEKRWEISKI